MNRIKQFLKSGHISRVVVIFLAGVFLLINTACGQPPAPRVSGEGSYTQTKGRLTESYDTIQGKEGGMNVYKDTDLRRDTSAADAKADRLVRNAKANVGKVDSPQDFTKSYNQGTPLGERVENLSDDIGESAQEVADDVVQGTRRGLNNLQRNTRNATETAKQTAQDAAANASNTIDKTVNPS